MTILLILNELTGSSPFQMKGRGFVSIMPLIFSNVKILLSFWITCIAHD